MPLNFHPKQKSIIICDYNTGFKEPEMVKRRPVIVISPRFRVRKGLCAVVPLSTTEPEHIMPYHYLLELEKALPPPWDSEKMWVKTDMLATVSLNRLNLIRTKSVQGQPRKYIEPKVFDHDFLEIQKAILSGLGIDSP